MKRVKRNRKRKSQRRRSISNTFRCTVCGEVIHSSDTPDRDERCTTNCEGAYDNMVTDEWGNVWDMSLAIERTRQMLNA